jgi:hypothetical protein
MGAHLDQRQRQSNQSRIGVAVGCIPRILLHGSASQRRAIHRFREGLAELEACWGVS